MWPLIGCDLSAAPYYTCLGPARAAASCSDSGPIHNQTSPTYLTPGLSPTLPGDVETKDTAVNAINKLVPANHHKN